MRSDETRHVPVYIVHNNNFQIKHKINMIEKAFTINVLILQQHVTDSKRAS